MRSCLFTRDEIDYQPHPRLSHALLSLTSSATILLIPAQARLHTANRFFSGTEAVLLRVDSIHRYSPAFMEQFMIDRRSFLVSASALAGIALTQPILGQVAGRGRSPAKSAWTAHSRGAMWTGHPLRIGTISDRRLRKSTPKQPWIITGSSRRTSSR